MRLAPALAWLLASTLGTTALGPAQATGPAPDAPEETTPGLPTEASLRQERARALVQRGQTLATRRMPGEAAAAFREALEVWPAYPLAQHELALTLVELGDLPGAEANLKAALALAPDFARSHQALGELYRRQGRYDLATASYREAVRLAPEDTVAWYGLAATLKAQKQDAGALWALESLLAVPDQPSEAPVIVEARREAAALIGRGVTARAPDEAPHHDTNDLADLTDLTEEPPGSDAPALPTTHGSPGALSLREGDTHFEARRYGEALRSYHAAWTALTAQASPPTAQSPAADASPTVSTDGASPPATPASDNASSNATSAEGGASDTGADAPRGDAELAYRIGATYAVMNDRPSAARWWTTALSLEPERELIARHLGLLLRQARADAPAASDDHTVERAKALLKSGDAAGALTLVTASDAPGAAYVEAECRLRLGDFERARQLFEELLGADADDRLALAGLGESLLRLGQPDQARRAITAWMGDARARPEAFLVLRRGEVNARLLAPFESED